MTFRPGDGVIPEGTLRLSVGALARIVDAFGAADMAGLAAALRTLDTAGARCLLGCLMVEGRGRERLDALSDAAILERLPEAVSVVGRALR